MRRMNPDALLEADALHVEEAVSAMQSLSFEDSVHASHSPPPQPSAIVAVRYVAIKSRCQGLHVET